MRVSITFATLLVAGTAMAHTGVKNAAVKARMDSMIVIGEQVKVLGQMAKGVTIFDAKHAQAAAAMIAAHAAETPVLFQANEDDPKSEARPEIWEDFADFTAKSQSLETLAASLSESIQSKNDLPAAMKSLGASCQACHELYRETSD